MNLCINMMGIPGWTTADAPCADLKNYLERARLPFSDASAKIAACFTFINYLTRVRPMQLIEEIDLVPIPSDVLQVELKSLRILARAYLENNTRTRKGLPCRRSRHDPQVNATSTVAGRRRPDLRGEPPVSETGNDGYCGRMTP